MLSAALVIVFTTLAAALVVVAVCLVLALTAKSSRHEKEVTQLPKAAFGTFALYSPLDLWTAYLFDTRSHF
jgi:uncharacterized membrane protein YphA (DoxX/SURF4 family)